MYLRTRVRPKPRGDSSAPQPIHDLALARHATVEYYDCSPQILADPVRMEAAMVRAAIESGATVLDSTFHAFHPQGVSGVVIVAESHFSVHAWPEHDYAAVDIFTCGDTIDYPKAFESIRDSLEAQHVTISADMHRGVPSNDGRARLVPTMNGRPERYELSWKSQFQHSNAWGLSSSVDIYQCDPATLRDADRIRAFVLELCDRLEMRRFGDCVVVDFGEDERVAGFSMTQLIETSLISGHFANASNTAYLDIFSCKYYEPRVVAEYALSFFKGSNYRMQVTVRR